uniref:Uncharacterized protein n=1 Tax=viral metagenome TaxID=1070528 RepID=A0A6C0K5N3_9ZZZZ
MFCNNPERDDAVNGGAPEPEDVEDVEDTILLLLDLGLGLGLGLRVAFLFSSACDDDSDV